MQKYFSANQQMFLNNINTIMVSVPPNGETKFENLPKFCGDKIFSYICGGILLYASMGGTIIWGE